MQIAQFEGKKDPLHDLETILEELHDPQQKLRIQLSVLSRCIDDLTHSSSAHDYERIERMLNQVKLPDAENERQIVLTTLVIMRHSLALERKDLDGANFLLDQLRGIGSSTDPLLQYLAMKTELRTVDSKPMNAALTLRNAELTATQLQQPLYKASLLLLICEQLVGTQLHRAKTIHAQIDIQSIEVIEAPSARRVVAKWWEVKSMFDDQERVMSLREAILRYRSVGCPNRARMLSSRLHSV